MATAAAPQIPLHNVQPCHATAAHQPTDQAESSSTASRDTTPCGYPKLAENMGYLPEITIFRRFASLNALTLLYKQSELMDIEQKLQEIQVLNNRSQTGFKSRYTRDWYFLKQSLVNDGEDDQLQLVQKADLLLEKYNTALLHQVQLAKLKPPGNYDLGYIQRYLASPAMGPFALRGVDADVWGSLAQPDSYSADLVATCPRHDEDMFSKWMTEKGVVKWYKLGGLRFCRASPLNGLVGCQDSTILRITSLISSMVASVLPIASIVILYCVESMKVRLGIIAIFNVAVSFCLAAFTSAKRAEIFAVSAAFSAVQVVFVQVGTSEA